MLQIHKTLAKNMDLIQIANQILPRKLEQKEQ